jgi:hypothetical protein
VHITQHANVVRTIRIAAGEQLTRHRRLAGASGSAESTDGQVQF